LPNDSSVQGRCRGDPQELDLYDSELIEKTGLSLRQVACVAAGISEKDVIERASTNKAAVIPITVGEGIIPSLLPMLFRVLFNISVFKQWLPVKQM
jgi:hypothetical protein